MSCLTDFVNLLIPELCVCCSTLLISNEKLICLKCQYDMPRTRYESFLDNPVARLFWGRILVENASSYFRFQKGSRFQALIHDLKYRDRKDIGRELGRRMGLELKHSPFSETQLILPVPLHKKKKRSRGYNQCDPIAEGLSKGLQVPFETEILERLSSTTTQTDKSRVERWTNVEGVFQVKEPAELYGKHILLADDVITTGSTLEACARAILELEGTSVSIATLAVALKSF